jgi:alanyl-tRNA synthetase
LENDLCQAEVLDVQNPVSHLKVHAIRVLHGELQEGDEVFSNIDQSLRLRTTYNHTATHLLQASLREVLGEHVKQSGSLVAPDRLRFDFSHYKPLTAWEIREIEERVNERIRQNIAVRTELWELDEAIDAGAMALFGEKYDEKVRVVTISGYSMELCGGTHVESTGEISVFKIISESSIAAGIRRVEAVTGSDALNRFLEDERILQDISQNLHVRRGDLVSAIEKMASDLKESNRKVEKLQLDLARKDSDDALDAVRQVDGVKVLTQRFENLDRNALRQLADQIRNKLESGVVVLGTATNGRVSLVVMVTTDLTDRIKAHELIQQIARIVDGGGGGKADMAEAGGKKVGALEDALTETYELVAESLKKSGKE